MKLLDVNRTTNTSSSTDCERGVVSDGSWRGQRPRLHDLHLSRSGIFHHRALHEVKQQLPHLQRKMDRLLGLSANFWSSFDESLLSVGAKHLRKKLVETRIIHAQRASFSRHLREAHYPGGHLGKVSTGHGSHVGGVPDDCGVQGTLLKRQLKCWGRRWNIRNGRDR